MHRDYRGMVYHSVPYRVFRMSSLYSSEGKGHTFESCRVRQFFFILQRDMRDPTRLQRIRASQQFDERYDLPQDFVRIRLLIVDESGQHSMGKLAIASGRLAVKFERCDGYGR
jgi:hypothetical protein